MDFKKAKKSNKEQKAKFPQLNEAPSHSLTTLPKTPNQPPPNSKETRAVKHFWVQPHSQWLVTSLLRNIYHLTTALSLQLERRPWSDHTLPQRMESWMPSASRWVQGAEPWSLLYLYATFFNMVDVFFLKSYTSSTWRWTMKPSSLLFLRYFLLFEQWSEALVWILGFLSQSQNNFKRASCGGLPNHQVTESFLDWLEIHRYFLLPFGFLDGIHIYIFSARNLVLALNGFKAPLLILYIPSHLVPVENISL